MYIARLGYQTSTDFVSTDAPLNDLAAQLDHLIDGRPIAVLDWPFYANAGDHFIWLGEKMLLKGRLKLEVLYEAPLTAVDFNRLSRLPRKAVFVCHGGGNFGDLYPAHQRFREAIAASFPDRCIIFMPQSVYYQSADSMAHTRSVFGLHRDLHLFVRDQDSLRRLRKAGVERHVRLGICTSLFLQPIVDQLVAHCDAPSEPSIRLLRSDSEQGLASADARAQGAVKDWSYPDDLVTNTSEALFDLKRCKLEIVSAFDGDLDRKSWRRLCGAVRLLATGREVITDRLHAHLLCMMMKKPHTIIDNSYGKIGSYFRTWERVEPEDAREGFLRGSESN
jgi:pyruvyl transferase EpsO